MIRIYPATLMDVDLMAGHLRAGDAAECEAFGLTQGEALRVSFEASLFTMVATDAGQPFAIWGAAADGIMGGVARPWLLTTGGVERHKRAFAEGSRALWTQMRPMFPRWENWVDARYTRSLRWLRWLGFRIGPAQLIGAYWFHHVTAEG